MPFKSKAQYRKFRQMLEDGEISESTFNKWMRETDSIEQLPEKVANMNYEEIYESVYSDTLEKVAFDNNTAATAGLIGAAGLGGAAVHQGLKAGQAEELAKIIGKRQAYNLRRGGLSSLFGIATPLVAAIKPGSTGKDLGMSKLDRVASNFGGILSGGISAGMKQGKKKAARQLASKLKGRSKALGLGAAGLAGISGGIAAMGNND